MDDDFRKAALDYHRYPRPGKLTVEPIKRMASAKDLSLAYSPGVAAACEEIVRDPDTALDLTARGNLVAVISNGTAVLGLGNIGALAGKPVMEGKAVLFKKFAGIDVFDIEVDAQDPDLFVSVVAALEPTFGAVNLEDIKAPECFEVEARLRERMRIMYITAHSLRFCKSSPSRTPATRHTAHGPFVPRETTPTPTPTSSTREPLELRTHPVGLFSCGEYARHSDFPRP